MAVIELKGTSFDYAMGMGVFEGLSMAFTDAKRSSSTLHDALSTLKSKIDVAATAASVDASQTQVQQAKSREDTKKSSLTLAYEKLDALITDTGRVDQIASSKISSREDDFYKRYYYLKPECEKTDKEKRDDWWAERWQNFKDFWGGVGNALKNFGKGIAEWCTEVFSNVISAVTAVVIIVAAIAICILCAPEVIAAIAIIVCAASAIYGIVDIGVMLCNNGKDIPTSLEESGHENWAAFVRGCDFGFTVASFILPVGAAIKSTMLTGGKTFLKATGEWIKTSVKGVGNSIKNVGKNIKNIFTCSGKPGFKGIIQSVGISVWKGFKSFTGIDDFVRLRELRNFSKCKPGWIIKYNESDWLFDKNNMSLIPNSERAFQTIDMANQAYKNAGSNLVIDSIPLTRNNGFIDVSWDDISLITLGKGEGFSLKNLDMGQSDTLLRNEIYGNKGSRVNQILNGGLSPSDPNYLRYTSSGPSNGGKYNVLGFTAHENFGLTKENIVPTFIHNPGKGGNGSGLFHYGGIEHMKRMVEAIPVIDNTIFRNIFINTGKEAITISVGSE